MPTVIARTRFVDFDRFLETVSTRGAAKRREHGSRGVRVFRNLDDPHAVVNVFEWDRAGVEAFMADPESEDIMAAAGLEGHPEFTYVELAAELDS